MTISYQNSKNISVKYSTEMNVANTVQYIINLTCSKQKRKAICFITLIIKANSFNVIFIEHWASYIIFHVLVFDRLVRCISWIYNSKQKSKNI